MSVSKIHILHILFLVYNLHKLLNNFILCFGQFIIKKNKITLYSNVIPGRKRHLVFYNFSINSLLKFDKI